MSASIALLPLPNAKVSGMLAVSELTVESRGRGSLRLAVIAPS
jgi:hypothetical protein